MVLLVEPSSAAAERVFFSSFKQFYRAAANVVIYDYIETSIKLQYIFIFDV